MASSKSSPDTQVYQYVVAYNTALSDKERELLPVEAALKIVRPVLDLSSYTTLSISGYETAHPLDRGRRMVERFLRERCGIPQGGINRVILPGDIVFSDQDGTWMRLPLNGLMELSKEDSERIRELFIYAVFPPWKRYDERNY